MYTIIHNIIMIELYLSLNGHICFTLCLHKFPLTCTAIILLLLLTCPTIYNFDIALLLNWVSKPGCSSATLGDQDKYKLEIGRPVDSRCE